MPIFVSRFSSARTGLANFQSLRAATGDIRADRRASSPDDRLRDREGEGDQTVPSGENSRGASSLLITSQRAEQLAQRITGQNARASERRTSGTQTDGRTTASTGAQGSARTTVSTASRANERETPEDRQDQARRTERAEETRVVLRPVLRSAVQRIDGLTRLLSAQRRGEEEASGTAPAARARLSTSLKIEESAAQSNVVRTAQAAQVTQARQAAQAAQAAQTEPAQQPRAEERLRETTELKQNLREDVATVSRGLVRDSIRQNTQNARRIAQNIFQTAASQGRPTSTGLSGSSFLQRTPASQGLFSTRRQTPTISNLSGLRSALALLGTNVNILVG
jgi:hypothetical protein